MRARRVKTKSTKKDQYEESLNLSDDFFTVEKKELPETSAKSAPVCVFQEPKSERFSSENLPIFEDFAVSSCAPSMSQPPSVVKTEETSSFSSLGAEFNPKVVLVRLDEAIVQKALQCSQFVVTSLHETAAVTPHSDHFLPTESAYICEHCGHNFAHNRRTSSTHQSSAKTPKCMKCRKRFKRSCARSQAQSAAFASRKISSENLDSYSYYSSNKFSDVGQDCEANENSKQESVHQQSDETTEKNETLRCAQLKVHFNNKSQVLSKKSSLTHYRRQQRQLRRSVTQRKAHASKRNSGSPNSKPCRNGVLSQGQQRRHLWKFVSSLCKDMDKQDACQILIDTLAAHCSKEMIDKISFDNAERLMSGPLTAT